MLINKYKSSNPCSMKNICTYFELGFAYGDNNGTLIKTNVMYPHKMHFNH